MQHALPVLLSGRWVTPADEMVTCARGWRRADAELGAGPRPQEVSGGRGWSGLSSPSQPAVTKEVPPRRARGHAELLGRQEGTGAGVSLYKER